MTRKTLLAATVLAATTIGGAAFADADHGQKGRYGSNDGPGMMMQDSGPGMMGGMSGMMGMIQRIHGNMMGGMMGGMGPLGGGLMDGMGPMGGGMMQMFDTDGDGTVTPEELRKQLQGKPTEYDSDGDGSLSISEFETLHGALIREMMVDRFQYLDADGDGAVTAEEMAAPAGRMERMQKMWGDQGRAQGRPGSGQQTGNGNMMNDN
jgi:EF hand